MKKTALFFLLPLLVVKSVSAQSPGHVTLSETDPSAGAKINITYNPEGTVLAGKADIEGIVYFLDGKDNPAADLDLKTEGKILKGSFTIPSTAKAFFIKLSKEDAVDNNNDKGYIYAVYKNHKPVEGAYASEGYIMFSGLGAAYGKIKADPQTYLSLYKKEFELYPNNTTDEVMFANALIAGKDPATANKLANKLAASGDEKNMTSAAAFFKRLNKASSADSLNAIIKTKFPDGLAAKSEMGLAFNKEKDLAKKEELYSAYVKKYPETAGEKNTVQDNFRLQLASAYLQAGKFDDYNRVAATVKEKINLAGALNNVAFSNAQKGEKLDEMAKLSKQSLDLVTAKINDPGQMPYSSPMMVKTRYQTTYDMYADTYAYILMKQGKFADALTYEAPVYKNNKGEDGEINTNYAMMLSGAGQDKRAMEVLEASFKQGKTTKDMDALMKAVYVKTKGSETGYDAYYTGLKTAAGQTMRTKMAKEMIKTNAPLFALKDLDGKTISLADLKGKVVVVDFWATWCGPCKASFPGMQMAVTKYKDNPNVQFVFIDTWETADNYVDGVKKFISDNKYSFHVLIDEKGSDGRQSKVVSSYGVDGIPTKFVLDASGNIRFKHVGFSGTAEGVLDEVSTMIDLATHPETVTSIGSGKTNAND